MTLLIPPPRDLTREGLAAYVYSLQMSRVEEERRKRAEEAADAGGGALGGGLGGAAGAVVGGLVGGPAGAMIGMGIGTAAGTGIGAAIEPPGRGYPGGTSGILAGGLQAGTRQAVQGFALREQLGERREPGTPESLGIRRTDVNAWLKSPAAEVLRTEGLTGQPLRQRGREELAGLASGIEAMREQEKARGRAYGLMSAKAERTKADAVRKDPDGFIFNRAEAGLREGFEGERTYFLNEMAIAQANDDQAQVRDMQKALRLVRTKEDAQAQRLKPKPQRPLTYEQLKKSGQPGQPGVGYVETNPITGNPMGTHAWTERGTWTFMPSGERFEFPDEPGVKYFYNAKHEPELVPQPKDPTIDRTSMMTPAQISKAMEEGADAIRETRVTYTDEKGKEKLRAPTEDEQEAAGKARAEAIQDTARLLRRRDMVYKSESVKELFARLSDDDRQFGEALQVIQQRDNMLVREVEQAGRFILLRLRETVEGVDVPNALNDQLKQYTTALVSLLEALPPEPAGGGLRLE